MKMIKKTLLSLLVATMILTGSILGQSKDLVSSQILKWKYRTSGRINASPVIYDDVLYIGSFDSCFYAIDVKTGTEKWHYKTQDQIYTTAIKYDSILCFESGNILYGLNLQGSLAWKVTLYTGVFQNQHDEWDYYRSSPTLAGTIVYIGSEKGLVYGVDITNGNKVFQCQAPTAAFTVKTTPAIYDNKIYFGDWDGVFYVYDLSTGNIVWKYDTKNDIKFSGWVNAIVTDPVIFNGAVYFGGRSCMLYCLDAKTGEKRWSFFDNGNMWIVGGPTIVDSVIYTGSSYQHVVRSFNALTGALRWSANVSYRVNGKPLVDGNIVYATTEYDIDEKVGTFIALDKNNGSLKERLNMNTQVYSTTVLNNGVLFFGGVDGYVNAINQQEFMSVSYPDIYFTGPDTLNFGTLNNGKTIDTTIYVYNKGAADDSISILLQSGRGKFPMTVQPTKFNISTHDSQAVRIIINTDSLKVYQYSGFLRFTSYNSIVPKIFSKSVIFKIRSTTSVKSGIQAPSKYLLNQNYPNPFNPETSISYQLANMSHVRLDIYDMLGREVTTLVDKEQPAGTHEVKFDGLTLTSGVYFYRIRADNFIEMKKMLLIK